MVMDNPKVEWTRLRSMKWRTRQTRERPWSWLFTAAGVAIATSKLVASDGAPVERPVAFGTPAAELAGTCLPPVTTNKVPWVVILDNFGRLARYAVASPAQHDWAMLHARRDLALGRHFEAMLAAAAEGKDHTPCAASGCCAARGVANS